jgi:hypothetical protein
MEMTASHVDYRQDQLRDVASSLRWERRRPRAAWLSGLQVAIGRRLVLAGVAVLASARKHPAPAVR